MTNAAAGAGFIGGNWPDTSASGPTVQWFTGNLAELTWYPAQLTAAQVSAQWQRRAELLGPDPGPVQHRHRPRQPSLTWTYDLLNSGRELSETNAEGAVTSYGYDTRGFQDETDADGHIRDPDRLRRPRQHGVQDHLPGPGRQPVLDLLLDLLPRRHHRAAGPRPAQRPAARPTPTGGPRRPPTPPTRRGYSYDSAGKLTAATTPPVAGFPSGRATTYAYTDGTTSAGPATRARSRRRGCPTRRPPPAGRSPPPCTTPTATWRRSPTPTGRSPSTPTTGSAEGQRDQVQSDTYPSRADHHLHLRRERQPGHPRPIPPVTNRVTGAVHTAQTTTSYDPDDNVLSQTVADLTGEDASRTATRTYNGYDQLATETDPAHQRRRTPTTRTGTRRRRPTRAATSPSTPTTATGTC